MKNIAVIGATGFTGLDLILMLSKHPRVKIKYLCATKNLGKSINVFDKRIKKSLPKLTSVKKIKWDELNLVFLEKINIPKLWQLWVVLITSKRRRKQEEMLMNE